MAKQHLQKLFFFVFLAGFLFFTLPQVLADEAKAATASTDLEIQVSSAPEAKIILRQSFVFPFLQGQNPMTQDNNITAALAAEITPISTGGSGEISFMPAAFFYASGGGSLGWDWYVPPLGNSTGIRRPVGNNIPVNPWDPPRNAESSDGNFDGFIWQAWGAGTFQADLGAIVPGEWSNVVFRTRQEFRYMAHSKAGSSDFWVFENDEGLNRNGWRYNPSYTLGYIMPQSPVMNFAGLMAEMDKPLYDASSGDNWGEGLGRWVFSFLYNFSVTPGFNMTMAVQMRTRLNQGITYFDNEDVYYQDYKLQDKGGRRILVFYRAALVMNFALR